MHKGVILLVKADSKEDAVSKVNEFMEPYGDSRVWDWFVIGGRWSGRLDKASILFWDAAKKAVPPQTEFGWTESEIKKHKPEFEAIWKRLGGKGPSPVNRDQYESDGNDGDIQPLNDCLEAVKDFAGDMTARANEEKKRAQEYADKDQPSMEGYCLRTAGELLSQNFCFDCNLYNVEEGDYSIPENPEGWFAVMIDMHN